MTSRLVARMVVAEIAILLLTFAVTVQAQAQTGAVLQGIVTLDSPVGAGAISIFNGSQLLQAEPIGPFANGTFEIALNPQVEALLPNTDLRIRIEVQEPDAPSQSSSPLTLSAVLHDFDPNSQVVFINAVTTVVCAYLDDNPDFTWNEAASKVEGVLGVPTSTTFESTHMLDFDSAAFIAASAAQGGFEAYTHSVASLADEGGTVNYAKGPAAIQTTASEALVDAQTTGTVAAAGLAPDFLGLITRVGKAIVKDALSTNPEKEAAGWIIDTILGGLTPAKEARLDQTSKQLDQISTQISDLGMQITKQIADLSASIKAAQDYIVYQDVALATNPAVRDLDGMRKRLYLLAVAAAAGEAHPAEASALSHDIFSDAPKDLVTIQDGLAGVNQTPGLISQWTKVVLDVNPNLRVPFPVFFSNDYLKSAATQYQYYLGAQFTGFDLSIEYAHTIFDSGPVLAKQITDDAINSFNLNFDTDMKLVAAGSHASIDGQNYYPSKALPADDLIVDSRSGLVWLNYTPCAPGKKPPCVFAVRQNPTDNIGYPLVDEFLANFSDGGVKFSLPSPSDWTNLVAPSPQTNFNYLNWLGQRGFNLGGQLDPVFSGGPPDPSTVTYWTSQSTTLNASGGPFYPNIVNWIFDVEKQGLLSFIFWIDFVGVQHAPFPKFFYPPAARILPRALDLDLLYREDPNVLGVPQP